MARLAIILHDGSPGPRELRLSRILDFFGIANRFVDLSDFPDTEASALEYAVFGSVNAVAAALRAQEGSSVAAPGPSAFYVYADREYIFEGILPLVFNGPKPFLQDSPTSKVIIAISSDVPDITGPMGGLQVSLQMRSDDRILREIPDDQESRWTPIVSAGDFSVFIRFKRGGIPVYFCASSEIIEIDQAVGEGFYDVKDHFCSVVPLIMFIRSTFREVAWAPQEIGACLIIDDPLLRLRYGFCDFQKMHDLMHQYRFTTNIAFIPWNWRRTSRTAGDFFRSESDLFSISIHGCDHTAGEFGLTSNQALGARARLAQSRMRGHQQRTGIQHDPIMVFPQGIFSSKSPEILKQNGYLAAINTELIPVDSQNARTRIRDIWDVAIMSYSGFPVFTRRYASHGIENFAFDSLLGKPCLIVAHHGFFNKNCARLIDLVEKLHSLHQPLMWRSLGEVVRRACRRKTNAFYREEVEMYATELLIENSWDHPIDVKICKRENQADLVAAVLGDGKPMTWSTEGEHIVFCQHIEPRSEKCFKVIYREERDLPTNRRSLRYEASVAMRRFLCEFRDDYLSKVAH